MTMTTIRIAFIKARWHADIVDNAYKGFVDQMQLQGLPHSVTAFDVPGAFEMPLLAKRLAESGNYEAVVAAAFVVDGGIYRHDFVAQAVVTGLMQAQLMTSVPILSVSLTPHNYQDTAVHNSFFQNHFVEKGREAANAVVLVTQLAV